MLWVIVAAFIVFGFFGAWVASQKHRGICEGFTLGLVFGPLGVIVEAVLPNMDKKPLARVAPSLFHGDEEAVEYILDRYRAQLAATASNWRAMPFHRKRSICTNLDREIAKSLELTRSEYMDCAAEARRRLLA